MLCLTTIVLLFATPAAASSFIAIQGDGARGGVERVRPDLPVFSAPKWIRGPRSIHAGVAFVDADLDGNKDFAFANASAFEGIRSIATLTFVDGSGRVLRDEELGATREPGLLTHPVIHAGDLDEDGFPDLLSISDRGTISVSRNTGSIYATAGIDRFARATRFRTLEAVKKHSGLFLFRTRGSSLADYNGDGLRDLAIAGSLRFFDPAEAHIGIVVLSGDGLGGFDRETTVYDGSVLALADSDLADSDLADDGSRDLVALGADNELILVEGLAASQVRQFVYRLPAPLAARTLAVAKVDGDRWPDFVVGGGTTGPAIEIHFGTRWGVPDRRASVSFATSELGSILAIVARDFNADSRTDLAVLIADSTDESRIVFMRGDGAGGFGNPETIVLPGFIVETLSTTPGFLSAVDLDDDDDFEIVAGPLREVGGRKQGFALLSNLGAGAFGLRLRGVASPGARGRTPRIGLAGGRVVLGNEDLCVLLGGAPPASAGVLLLNTRFTPVDLGGLTVNVLPAAWVFAPMVGLGALGGHASLRAPIPADPSVALRTWIGQWLVADPTAPNRFGVSATRALELRIAPR